MSATLPPPAEYRAPIEARVNVLESSLLLAVEVVDRLRQDVVDLDAIVERQRSELKELRAAVEGKS